VELDFKGRLRVIDEELSRAVQEVSTSSLWIYFALALGLVVSSKFVFRPSIDLWAELARHEMGINEASSLGF
jgi:hypothetical protein